MVLFALLMLVAAYFMLKQQRIKKQSASRSFRTILFYGLLIGLVTGFLGGGGSFLLIPALVMLVKLPMKTVVGTSLIIIAVTSLLGFAGDLHHHTMDCNFLMLLSLLTIAGVLAGNRKSRTISGQHLKMVLDGLL